MKIISAALIIFIIINTCIYPEELSSFASFLKYALKNNPDMAKIRLDREIADLPWNGEPPSFVLGGEFIPSDQAESQTEIGGRLESPTLYSVASSINSTFLARRRAAIEYKLRWRDLYRSLRNNFYDISYTREALKLAEEKLKRMQRLNDDLEIMRSSGKIRAHDFQRMKIELSSAKLQVWSIEKEQNHLFNNLLLLLGKKPETITPDRLPDSPANYFALPAFSYLLDTAIKKRPEILLVAVEKTGNERSRNTAFLSFLPSLEISCTFKPSVKILLGANLDSAVFSGFIFKKNEMERKKIDLEAMSLLNKISNEVLEASSMYERGFHEYTIALENRETGNILSREANISYQEGDLSLAAYLEQESTSYEIKQKFMEAGRELGRLALNLELTVNSSLINSEVIFP
ncbi:MAG TPA: hypothetical protein DC049_01190 [Spirochaetia bacterium]|nr:hypothetical protein [Spirochaetia bacterium]